MARTPQKTKAPRDLLLAALLGLAGACANTQQDIAPSGAQAPLAAPTPTVNTNAGPSPATDESESGDAHITETTPELRGASGAAGDTASTELTIVGAGGAGLTTDDVIADEPPGADADVTPADLIADDALHASAGAGGAPAGAAGAGGADAVPEEPSGVGGAVVIPSACTGVGDGAYCGDELEESGWDANWLYHCWAGALTYATPCPGACKYGSCATSNGTGSGTKGHP